MQSDGEQGPLWQWLENPQNRADLMKALYSLVRAFCSNPKQYDDAVQELFSETVATALPKQAHYDPSRPAKLYLLGFARNIAQRMKRERAISSAMIRLDAPPLSDGAAVDLWESLVMVHVESTETAVVDRDWMEQTLATASESDRYILQLAIVDELNGDEIAQQLGINPGTARVRLSRALQRLRERVKLEESVSTQQLRGGIR
jgi:RNA polymerase sigma factor (sigma-70 family)